MTEMKRMVSFMLSNAVACTLAATAGAMVLHVVTVASRRSSAHSVPRHDAFETLSLPIRVVGWKERGLVAEDGRLIALPGIESMPVRSPLLDELLRRGVEIDPEDGRAYGLLPIDHWLPMDPIREHLARVDVGSLVNYLEQRTNPEVPGSSALGLACDYVSAWGWNSGCYYDYQRWLEH
ncbi:MAG: hypothetical protein ACKVXR_17015 [Planctomycetota bacterium]